MIWQWNGSGRFGRKRQWLSPIWIFFTKTAGFLEEMICLRNRVETGEMKKTFTGRTASGKYRVLSGYSAGKLSDLLFKSGLCGKDTGRRSGCTVKLPVYGTSRHDRVCLGTERMGFSGRIGTVLQVYSEFEGGEVPTRENVRKILYWYVNDYCQEMVEERIRQAVDPALDFAVKIIKMQI